jgi:hypothetical protein
MPTHSRFLLGQAGQTRQPGKHLGQLEICLLYNLPALKNVLLYGSAILRSQD